MAFQSVRVIDSYLTICKWNFLSRLSGSATKINFPFVVWVVTLHGWCFWVICHFHFRSKMRVCLSIPFSSDDKFRIMYIINRLLFLPCINVSCLCAVNLMSEISSSRERTYQAVGLVPLFGPWKLSRPWTMLTSLSVHGKLSVDSRWAISCKVM